MRRLLLATLLALFALSGPALAHGFGQRFTLPLPLSFWITGAGATIVVTFVLIALFLRDTSGVALTPR